MENCSWIYKDVYITKLVCKDFGAPLIKFFFLALYILLEKDKDQSAWRLKPTTSCLIITVFYHTGLTVRAVLNCARRQFWWMRILAIHPTKIFLNNSKWIEINIKSHCWSLCPNWRIDYLNIWLTIMRVLSLVIIVKHIPKKNVGISRLKDDESNKSRKKCKEEKKKRTCQSWESESSSNGHYHLSLFVQKFV